MESHFLLQTDGFVEKGVGLLQNGYATVEVVEHCHDHLTLLSLFLSVVDDGGRAECQHNGDGGSYKRQHELLQR